MITNAQIENWLSAYKNNANWKSNAQELSTPKWLKLNFPILHQDEFARVYLSSLQTDLPDIVLLNENSQDCVTMSIREQSQLAICQKFNQQFDQLVELASGNSVADIEARTARTALVYLIAHHGEPVVHSQRIAAITKALGALKEFSKDIALSKEVFAYISWLLCYGGDLSSQTKLALIDCLVHCLPYCQDKIAACLEDALVLQLGKYDGSSAAKEICTKLIGLCAFSASGRLTVLLDVIAESIDDSELKETAASAADEMRAYIEIHYQNFQPQFAQAGN